MLTEKTSYKVRVSALRPHLLKNLSTVPEPLVVPMIGIIALSERMNHVPNLVDVMDAFGLTFNSYNI